MADSLLTIGGNTLATSQYALSVYSNNVANADTEGYRRQSVEFKDSQYVNTGYGPVGMGVNASEVQRHTDIYLEEMYLARFTGASRWNTSESYMNNIENVFNQSNGLGLDASMADWFTGWEDLSASPDSLAVRTALTSQTESMAATIRDMDADLARQEELMNEALAEDVARVNEITDRLAEINKSIGSHPDDNGLLNERDNLVRELSGLVDAEVQYRADGMVDVRTGAGQSLVDGPESYELRLEGPKSWNSLTGASTFDGAVYFEGSSSNEITMQVVSGGTADGGAGAATYRVSYDGGKTWLTDDDGNEMHFTADGETGAVTVDGVDIWFGAADGSGGAASGDLATGDTFTVMPKSGVYWYKNTSSFMNVTPLSSGGVDDDTRLTGGSIAGLCTTRDQYLGQYRTELDALASSLIWETNFAHSQGAGLEPFSEVTGTYAAEDSSVPLADSGLTFAGRVQAGGMSIALYDEATGESLGVASVDFSSIPPGQATFDPEVHSLDDVAAAVNATFPGQVTASVSNGVLSLVAADGVDFQFAGDSTGLLAATGINTFFTGTGAGDIGVNPVLDDPARVNASTVDGAGEVNAGGNETAATVAELANKDVTIVAADGSTTISTIQGFFAALVAEVGADASAATFNADYNEALAMELYNRQEEVGGVNLDEEMILIERNQRLYQAASSMIQTSNEMFETLMSLK